jgi:hypothetical protein
MRPDFAKIIEKVHISTYFESPETDLHIAENACRLDYADSWSSKRVHSLSRCQRPDRGTSDYGCEDMLKLYPGVSGGHLPITGNHIQGASNYNT